LLYDSEGGGTGQIMDAALGDTDAVYVRQKLQVFEQFCAACEKENQYLLGPVSLEMAERGYPKDDELKAIPTRIMMQENSTLCQLCFCGSGRSFTMDIMDADGKRYAEIRRECRCCLDELELFDRDGNHVGGAHCECRCLQCCIGNMFIRLEDNERKVKGYIKHVSPSCCNGCQNCCAPSCCNEDWHNYLLDENEQVVGHLRNVYPGLGMRCVADADNYLMAFPPRSSINDKLLWLSGLILMDYVFFEKQENDQGS